MWYQRGFLADGTDALQGGDLPSIAFGHSRHSISLDRVPTPSLQATFVFLSSAVQREQSLDRTSPYDSFQT